MHSLEKTIQESGLERNKKGLLKFFTLISDPIREYPDLINDLQYFYDNDDFDQDHHHHTDFSKVLHL